MSAQPPGERLKLEKIGADERTLEQIATAKAAAEPPTIEAIGRLTLEIEALSSERRRAAMEHRDDLARYVLDTLKREALRVDQLAQKATDRDTLVVAVRDVARSLGQVIGIACARSKRGDKLMTEVLDELYPAVKALRRPSWRTIDIPAFWRRLREYAIEAAVLDAVNAWQWNLPREERERAAELYPWIGNVLAMDEGDPCGWLASFHLLTFAEQTAWALCMIDQLIGDQDIVRDSIVANLEVPGEVREQVATEMRRRLQSIRKRAKPERWSLTEPEMVDGVMAFDASFIAELEQLGKQGEKYAKDLSEAIPEQRLAACAYPTDEARRQVIATIPDQEKGVTDPVKPQSHWYGFVSERAISVPRRYSLLAKAICRFVKDDLERPRSSVTDRELGHEKLPKLAAEMSWAFGGQAIEVDGASYVSEPAVATNVLMPRTVQILPDTPKRRPEQGVLPMVVDVEDPLEKTVSEVVADSAHMGLMSTYASKLALVTLADPKAWRGSYIEGPVEEWARMMYPETRRIQPRDIEAAGDAFREIASPRFPQIVLPDGSVVRGFSVRAPRHKATRGMMLGLGLDLAFRHAVGPFYHGKETGPYNGAFLFDLGGACRLANNKPGLLRCLVRASAAWNGACDPVNGEYQPERLSYLSLDHHAAMYNAYPMRVVEFLQARGEDRKRLKSRRGDLAKYRRDLRQYWEELEGKGLVVLDMKGEDFRLAPPREWFEARARLRKRGEGGP